MQSRFISFEGGEGVGKTTLINLLAQKLQDLKILHIVTREPGGTPSAEAIRQVFVSHPAIDRLTPLAEFLLASAARAQHVAVKIKKNLAAHTWVLTDRFSDSSYVYQGILGGVDFDFIDQVNQKVCAGLIPDLTILVDLNPETALARVKKRNAEFLGESHYDREDVSGYQKIAEGFKKVAAMFAPRFLILDGAKQSDILVEEIVSEFNVRGFL